METSRLHRATSPPSSGRSSPANPRARARGDDGYNRKDKNYRRYAAGVERALTLFDTALQGWADYISFLGRLLKALQARPSNNTEIPHKTIVAKRLAQCLNPNLPSGVHQKTLEVYGYLFSVLNKEGLGRDLSIYLPGLSPTLSFASLSVKPALLSIFETYISVLDPISVRPALKAIIQSLLPGLDEETSEEFERAYSILNRFKDISGCGSGRDHNIVDASNDQYFWQCLFLVSITSSSRRQGALAYLNRNLPKLGTSWRPFPASPSTITEESDRLDKEELPPEIEAVASPEPGLLVRCFATGLCDGQLLIQRGFLDLLVTHLPLHSAVLRRKVTSEDLEKLVAAAVSVVARREMSLNRRLWAWFLGPELLHQRRDSSSRDSDDGSTSEPHDDKTRSEYFQRYGLAPLISSIKKMLTADRIAPSFKARPFRICLSLMDRWEIGEFVVPQIFLEALSSVWRYQKTAPSKESFNEVLRSATVFFDGVESRLIWAEITKILLQTLQAESFSLQDGQDRLDLVLFIITKFNVREEEMLNVHIPIATLLLLTCIQPTLFGPIVDLKPAHGALIRSSLNICSHLVDLIPQRAFSNSSHNKALTNINDLKSRDRSVLHIIQEFYNSRQGAADVCDQVVPAKDLGAMLLDEAIQMVTHDLNRVESAANIQTELSILEKLIRKIPDIASLDWEKLLTLLMTTSKDLTTHMNSMFQTISTIVFALEVVLLALPSVSLQYDYQIRQIVPNLIVCLWPYLSPSQPEYNVEAARCILRLQKISPENRLVESSITTLMINEGLQNQRNKLDTESGRRFITLWAHVMSTTNGSQTSHPNFLFSKSSNIKESNEVNIDTIILARPLLLLLDSLSDTKTEIFIFSSGWISSVPNLQIIVHFLINHLQVPPISYSASSTLTDHDTSLMTCGSRVYDSGEQLYHLQTLSNLLRYSSDNAWSILTTPVEIEYLGLAYQNNKNDSTSEIEETTESSEPHTTAQVYLTRICLAILQGVVREQEDAGYQMSLLRLAAISILHQMMLGLSSEFVWEANLEIQLIEILTWSIKHSDVLLQVDLMNLILLALKLRTTDTKLKPTITHRRTISRDGVSRPSLSAEKTEKEHTVLGLPFPPSDLLDCLVLGISSPSTHPVLEHWVRFLDDCLLLYADNAFQILLPLVNCFIKSLELVLKDLQASFGEPVSGVTTNAEPVTTIIILFNGLEQILARAHDQLIRNDVRIQTAKTPEQIQGFFGNMVSGVFASEAHRSKTTTANNRLTVLLCFKDTVRICLKIWSWGDRNFEIATRNTSTSASYSHTSLRIKNRTRRTLEHLFVAEALECLETLIESYYKSNLEEGGLQPPTVFNLLNALDGSRPRNTIPAIFNGIYSRTNPNALDPARKSSLASDLSDIDLAGFLVVYTRSLEDDAMDEIWTDCMTFLRDVLANPLPHRQTLPKLLQFTAVLGEKVDNTNFGEQRRMRRDLSDLFVRILAATFTTKPLGFMNEASPAMSAEKTSSDSLQSLDLRKSLVSEDVIAILASILPGITKILIDSDRIVAAITTISTQVLIPTFRWKSYPQNVTHNTLNILYSISKIPEASKIWRKDVGEAFNDPKFFCVASLNLAKQGWLTLLRQWTLLDKDCVPDFLARLSSPTSAGIMFGVGASSARLEADRKTQLNLRRMAILVLAAADDAFVVNLVGIQEKLADLMNATAASSPSSATRAEIFMLLRGLALKISPIHMTSFWPIINSELYDAISSLFSHETHDTYNINCVVQACKLLEILLILAPDDFQMSEWLFITDTVDAVYRPADWDPIALVDELAEDLDSIAGVSHSAVIPFSNTSQSGKRKPLLTSAMIKGVPKEDIVDRVLRPFFRQLSINVFESTYSMEIPDWESCYDDLLIDVFEDSTIV